MKSIDLVLNDYREISTEIVDARVTRRTVSSAPQTDAEREIRNVLPALLADQIERTNRNPSDYRVYGSVGQINFPFAKIPWVAALHRDISSSTERGYYIVLLFREDMRASVLSLNQGYTQFKDAFGSDAAASTAVLESAKVALSYLNLPEKFIRGRIDLGATGHLGNGYERGAIASVAYSADHELPLETFLADFSELLDAYDDLRVKVGPHIIDVVSGPTEDQFQEAATALSKPSQRARYTAPPPGPVAPPPKSPRARGSGYKRDPRVSGAAIAAAAHLCEVETTHMSFVARTTKLNFVEAHHLIPLQFQDQFTASLDVMENIVVLCPTCHRKLHHAQLEDKAKIIKALHFDRETCLKARGLDISAERLVSIYRSKLEEE